MIRMLELMSPRRLALVVAAVMVGAVVVSTGVAAAIGAVRAAEYAQYASPTVPDTVDEEPASETDDVPAADQASPELEPAAETRAPMPANCEALFSPAMVSTMQSYGVVLNPAWADGDTSVGLSYADAELTQYLSSIPNIRCLWATPNGGSGFGLESRIAPVTTDEAAVIQSRLTQLGYTPLSELGGTRYIYRVDGSAEGAAYGESHIVVGGYWFATSWLELGVNGYTADMVNQLLG